MGFVSRAGRPLDFSNNTLIVPDIAVGNTGQLAVDALLSTYDVEKVGIWHDRCLTPVVGNDALATTPVLAKGSLSLGAEVFQSISHRLVIVQLRAPICQGAEKEFGVSLLQWARSMDIAKVFLLSSKAAYARSDRQILIPFGHISNLSFSQTKGDLDLPSLVDFGSAEAGEVSSDDKAGSLGTAFSKHIFQESETASFPLLVLAWFTSEGDNSHEGLMLANLVDQLLTTYDGVPRTLQWRTPLSWSKVFGPPPDITLY